MSDAMMLLDNHIVFADINKDFMSEEVKVRIREIVESIKKGTIPQGVILS